jgi:hypothetical protein
MLGQVWSKADCNGIRELGYEGGVGSVLAVTAQNPGADEVWGTSDDLNEPINSNPGAVTLDMVASDNCQDQQDRVRGFASKHIGGVVFVFADGSTRMVSEEVDISVYRNMSTIRDDTTPAVGDTQ